MLSDTMKCCKEYRHEFIMPEHLLLVMMDDNEFYNTLDSYYSANLFQERIENKLDEVETVPEDIDYEPEASTQMGQLIEFACAQIINSSATALDVPHLVMGLLNLPESWACYLLKDALGDNESNFMSDLISAYELADQLGTGDQQKGQEAWRRLVTCMNTLYQQHNPLIGREQELQRTIQVLC